MPRDVVSFTAGCRWSQNARAFLPPGTGVRALNALVKQTTQMTVRRTVQDKFKSLYPELRELGELEQRAFSLDVSWTNDEEIRLFNRDYRGKDRATDVLSFPFWEGETLFDGDEVPLGDLVLSLETAVRQAKELKHSLEQELAFLSIHGTLHLLGFDHDTDAKRRAMFSWQDDLAALMPKK